MPSLNLGRWADVGQTYTSENALYWLLGDIVAVTMRKVKQFLGDKRYLYCTGNVDPTRLSSGFYGDNILVPSAHLSAVQLDDLIPELVGAVYEGMHYFTSTGIGIRPTLARREMTQYLALDDGNEDGDADPSLLTPLRGRGSQWAVVCGSFQNLM